MTGEKLKTADLRELMDSQARGEISYTRMLEIINAKIYKAYFEGVEDGRNNITVEIKALLKIPIQL